MASYRHPTDESKAGPVRVLVAEDEAMIALSLCDLLEAEGYTVTLVSDGAQALAAAQQLGSTLDALLTDLNMPFMGGEDLIRALRSLRPGLPVVVLTGSPPPGGLEELRQQGGGTEPLQLLRAGAWDHRPVIIRCSPGQMAQAIRGGQIMGVEPRKPTSWERAQVDVSKPAEVVGWCNKWKVTPEQLRAAVAEVGTSAVSIARVLGKTG